ncbi:hypothetical protein MHM89_02185 [Pseudoalteromonas sp. CNC9-20]|uniref:hypothetical protein n=1 Tax=Pseudoalteromonas sp. CNC9-20 TaxID=2917750 RepID=UPI001EF40819|nr:hypothetical protein [Pseudoalteromonas sp. CNC9-20]MCG7568724.1 hypothetical protein [Pseudoalteromonas sp. CNC9-20]
MRNNLSTFDGEDQLQGSMIKHLALLFCFLHWCSFANTDMVYIAEKTITPEQASEFGIHRLTSGNDPSWNVLVYPSTNANNEPVAEASITFIINGKEVALVLSKISNFERTSFKRSDIVVDTTSGVAVNFTVTYGSQRLILNNITNLKSNDYETFAMQYNKRLNSDND